jgi:mono/diheme cytochrome c family protein
MFSAFSGLTFTGPRDPLVRRAERGRTATRSVVGFFLAIHLATVAAGAPDVKAAATTGPGYNRDVRPLLSDNCFACHGPDKNQRKGKLRLDVREAALEKQAIVPGKPDESELIKRIYTTNADDVMPPPESHKTLTSQQKELLARWIATGAEYEPHWAYIKPVRSEVPQTRNADWIRNPIDAFILHTLESMDVAPSPEADKRTLLRRLSLDLIGLPPTPDEVEDFVRDANPQAYEHQVDRLLRSSRYGERMAVPWLDVVRFADTVGYHGDQNVNVFPYRDYVINAFNENKPFDQFTIEQLAGDLLPHPTPEQQIATGFNRLNMVTREGGAQPKEYLAKYAADRVRTVSAAWLGSTMGCCECHDHKFDPFSTKDFYSMEAFFADIKQWGVYQDYDYTPNPDLKGWSNDHPFPPEIQAESPYLRRRMEKLRSEIARVDGTAAAEFGRNAPGQLEFDSWCRFGGEFVKRHPDGWEAPTPAVWLQPKDTNSPPDTSFPVLEDGSIVFTGKPAEQTQLTLPLSPGWLAAIRLELIPRKEHGGRIIRGEKKSMVVSLSAKWKPLREGETNLAFYTGDADHKEPRYSNGFDVLDLKDGWKTSGTDCHVRQTGVWLLDHPILAKSGDVLILKLGRTAAGCVRVSVSPFTDGEPLRAGAGTALRAALTKTPASCSSDERTLLRRIFLLSTGREGEAFAQRKKLRAELLECRGGRSPTLVTVAWKPNLTRILPRGNWQSESGEIVEPAVPHFLPQVPDVHGRRLTRLDLARWIVSRDNPLTARTLMNRLWKQLFGTGISAVVDDLGAQGEWPTHPELLDWLAVEFMDSGWDFKHIVKLMVMSSTYRQSSNPRPEIKEQDPNNRLLASQSPRRLEAEFVRDNALFIAGLLDPDIGGPSTHPYQPPGYYANLQFPDRDYHPENDERQYRRGVYTHWQRTFLQPMLANFDAPSREECVAARNVSNTPQQALTLLNDPTFTEASRVFAERLLASMRKSDDARLDLAYEKALARPIKSGEQLSLKQFLALQREHYRENPDEARKLMRVGIAPEPKGIDETELAAWTQVCRVVLNLHETITRY